MSLAAGAAAVGVAVTFVALGVPRSSAGSQAASSTQARVWTQQHLTGSVSLNGEVPLAVAQSKVALVAPHPANAKISLNFGFPIANAAGLNALIAQESRSHQYLSRADLYNRFSPPTEQLGALQGWLQANGFTVTHSGLDRMALTATATTAQIERALHIQINDYVHPGYSFHGVKVAPYRFYANAGNPQVPARLGLQTVSGLSDVDRFFTSAQLAAASSSPPIVTPLPPKKAKNVTGGTDVRSGGYFPGDIRSLYDVTGHGFDGTGQTLGFTLWGAGERQPAMTAFASATGDTPIVVDPDCVATGNSATAPSACATQAVAGDHLMTILENGNTANAQGQYDSNVETALDVEQAHGIATHAAMKYYDADCSDPVTPGSGLSDSGNCNGSDVGLEDAVEDAANDPTLHSVSNSWGYGGEAEWGLADPFLIAVRNSFAIAAAAGTTFYFSTGDFGTYFSGFPADEANVVAVGGTTLFSTAASPSALSTEDTWAAAGSWCSNLVPRPSWQNIPAVNNAAGCPGRSIPDVSAVADTNSSVRFVSTLNNSGGTESGGVGGTSVAAPEMNGLQAVTQSFIAAQTYPGGHAPAIGFAAPVIYQLGNGGHGDAYYRDVQCGNTANPASGPDGDAAQPGWDPATGWGAPDWFHFATGYAIALGATNLSVPSSLATHYGWNCAKTPSNSSERGVSFPSSSVGYAVGGASGGTPWYAKMLASGAWGAVNTFFKTADGGKTWTPSNSDMMSIACTSATACVEVGDGGRIKTTTDGGTTWSDTPSGFDKALTQVQCPSATVCYAAGDRGFVLKSSDAGKTWAYLHSTDGNPIYGLTCPTASVCYATDIYAHIVKTSDGGATWTWQRTPVTTPGVDVPGSGGPNPFAGLFGVSCVDANTCVAVGGFPPAGTDPPIVATTNGGTTWTLETSNSGTNNYLHAVACLPASTTCYAVGRGGSIVTTTDLVNWTKMTSGTTNALNSITCLSTTSCVASGQSGTLDVLSGSTWTATTGNGGGAFLAGVTCLNATTCYAAGKQGVTLATTNGTTWTQQAGGGTTQQMNSVSCPTTSVCFAAGAAGTILATSNGGQTWLPQTSGTTNALNGISCASTTKCAAAGAAGTVRYTTDGSTWSGGTSGTTSALNGVACSSATACTAVGAAGTIVTSADGGATWTAQTSGVATALNAVACPTAACYATGAAATGGNAVILNSVNGTTWTAQASNSNGQPLSGIACIDAVQCFAGGAIGTVVATTDGGATWTQRGNPISGPTTALNAGPTGITAVNAAACNIGRCALGTASSGDIMTSPLLYVTVTATTAYGSAPNLTFAPSDPALSYSQAGANVTGTLTCATTATDHSVGGAYPVSACNGLSADGFSVVYNYAASSDTVLFPSVTSPVTGTVPSTLALTLGTPAAFGAFTPGVAKDYFATMTATVVSTAANGTLTVADPSATATGHLVNGAFSLPQPVQADATSGAGVGGAFAPVGGSAAPTLLLSYATPVSNDAVTINFKQSIGSTDALRTGSYSKTLTFTLSTTAP
jgi:photosystem II stability/assembly factor-like uncharacterized protein